MRETRRIRVYGIVQGVGFRPTVDRHATTAGIAGTVCNKGPYVEIFAQGTPEQVERFCELLRDQPPRRAAILKLDVTIVPANEATAYAGFSIVRSERTQGEIYVSPDIAICDDCKRELFDPTNRRYLHPFINCTCCGPRLTILDALPYDRERTSMGDFPMCPTCAHEYHDPASRRYDAQPVCCNDCGPEVYLLDRPERGREAITEARRIIAAGGIVAVKGIGGFHLCCDATSSEAVSLLRARKRRPGKPFAIMATSLEVARRECEVDSTAERILDGHQKPILLLPRHASGHVCEEVAPGNPKLGIMLPYAPLQLLLFSYDDDVDMPDCLVMTSANDSGAPICRDDEDARSELGPLCDAILSHDRLIRMRADDTVLDLYHGQPYMVRRSRGWAPLPTVLSTGFEARVLAVGGELKNSFCVGVNDLFYLSPYVGDLTDVRTVNALEETVERLQGLLETSPQVVACDLHPRYNSTVVAERIAAERDLPLVRVQHHYAHVVSCMAENDVPGDRRVLGVSFDGTGYGEDGTIWGGELLLCDYDDFERVAHIAPFPQAGGDLAAREGWRVAVGMLGTGDDVPGLAERLGLCSAAEARVVQAMVRRGVNCVTSTSAGRLFDAVAAVLGVRRASTYEGEAATHLMFAAQRARGTIAQSAATGPRPFGDATATKEPRLSATDKLFAWILQRRLAGDDVDELALCFHEGLAACVEGACAQARAAYGIDTVALTGGCFQNLLLLDLCVHRLQARGFAVLTHHLVPPNDGGVALGQAVVAAQYQKHAFGDATPKGACVTEGIAPVGTSWQE